MKLRLSNSRGSFDISLSGGPELKLSVERDAHEAKQEARRKHEAVLAVAEILRQSFQVRAGETITEDLARERANNAAQAISEYIQAREEDE